MTATPPPKPLAQRPVLWLSIVLALVLATAAVTAGYFVGSGGPSAGDASAPLDSEGPVRPEPESGGASSAPVEPVETTAPVNSVIPTSCDGIYSTDWTAQMDGLVLNPAWTQTAEPSEAAASFDDELGATLSSTNALVCRWTHADGGSDRGLNTNVAPVTPEQQAAALARMQDIGFDCYEELGGTRCVNEESSDAGGGKGESHFLRDGVWIATKWLNVSPDGYTHDIVNTLWA